MSCRAKFAGLLIALASLGALGVAQTAGTHADRGSPPGIARGIIRDPSMRGQKAIEVTYPAGWRFKGVMYLDGVAGWSQRSAGCALAPSGVFRVTSPDGLSFVEALPMASWGWATGPDAVWYRGNDCFPLPGPISAQEFLKDIAATLRVEYMGAEPVPAADNARIHKIAEDINAAAARPNENATEKVQSMITTVELARGIVVYQNGAFRMKGRLTVELFCSETRFAISKRAATAQAPPGVNVMNRCYAGVVYLVAPESQYAALVERWDRPDPGVLDKDEHDTGWQGMGARPLDSWMQWRELKQTADLTNSSAEGFFIQEEEMLSWRGELAASVAVRERISKEFNDTLQAGLEKALVRSAAVANSKHMVAPDWVDYLLYHPR